MSVARAAVLSSVRRALGARPSASGVEARLTEPPPGVIPARGRNDSVAMFLEGAARVGTTVDRAASAAEVPARIAAYLAERNLSTAIKLAPDPDLRDLPWAEAQLQTREGRGEDHDTVSVVQAFAAVAETGTLVMISGAESPTTLNCLPDTHIVVVHSRDLVGAYDDAWARLRARGALPRLVTWITGPSRTADIEQEILVGIHGPRRLHVVMIDGGQA